MINLAIIYWYLLLSVFVDQDKSNRPSEIFLLVEPCLSATCMAEVGFRVVDFLFSAAVTKDKSDSVASYYILQQRGDTVWVLEHNEQQVSPCFMNIFYKLDELKLYLSSTHLLIIDI